MKNFLCILSKLFFSICGVVVLPITIFSGQIIYKLVTVESRMTYRVADRQTHKYTGWDASKDQRKAVLILLSIAGGSGVFGFLFDKLQEPME